MSVPDKIPIVKSAIEKILKENFPEGGYKEELELVKINVVNVIEEFILENAKFE